MISIVTCCHGTKLCAHGAQDFRSQQPMPTYDLFSKQVTNGTFRTIVKQHVERWHCLSGLSKEVTGRTVASFEYAFVAKTFSG